MLSQNSILTLGNQGEGEIFYVESAAYGLFSYAQSYQEEVSYIPCVFSVARAKYTSLFICLFTDKDEIV